jgi:hypothetical protein
MRLWAFSFAHVAQPASELGLDLVQVSSSFVHAGIMAWQALTISGEHGHLSICWGVPALRIVAAVLAILTIRARQPAKS